MTITSTHIWIDHIKTRSNLCKIIIKALNNISLCDNGTRSKPEFLAAIEMNDGRTLIQTIYEDGNISFNDGYYIIECVEYGCLYVDITSLSTENVIKSKDSF